MASLFLSLPVEVVQQVILACHPNDVFALAKCCRHFWSIIHTPSDVSIWRSLFLIHFDDPRILSACYLFGHPVDREEIYKVAQGMTIEWKVELKRRMMVMNVLQSREKAERLTSVERAVVMDTLTSIVETCSPPFLNLPGQEESKNIVWLGQILAHQSAPVLKLWSTLSHPLLDASFIHPQEHDARARVHAYFDFTIPRAQPDPPSAPSLSPVFQVEEGSISSTTTTDNNSSRRYIYPRDLRLASQEMTYSGENYYRQNHYGPFQHSLDAQGTNIVDRRASPPPSMWQVNWAQVAAIKTVVACNLEDATTRQSLNVYGGPPVLPPTGLDSLIPWSAPGFTLPPVSEVATDSANSVVDWAGVSGNWKRAVCFLESRTPPNEFQEPITPPGPLRFCEAVRMDSMTLHITRAEPTTSSGSASRYGNRPRLHFEGTSTSAFTESLINGFVESHPTDGTIRWQMTRRSGRVRWNISGVQLGGAGTKIGVVGSWTAPHHRDFDPVGPFWMWKVE